MNMIKSICFIMIGFIIGTMPIHAEEFTASLAKMPVYAESKDKGILVDLVKKMAEITGNTVNYSVVPFARSIHNVESANADFHLPLIAIPDFDPPDYDYSTTSIFRVNFVLYAKKGSGVNISNLAGKKIETDIAHVPYLKDKGFTVIGSSNLESSLRKVNIGRIDGLIFADFAIDPILKKFELTGVSRELYQVFNVHMVIPNDTRGGDIDEFITTAITKLQDNGEYGFMGLIDVPYDNWQP